MTGCCPQRGEPVASVRSGPDDGSRCGDLDREHAVDVARHACRDGLLTLEEYSARLDAIWSARTHGDLRAALTDLPVAPTPTTAGNRSAWRPYVFVVTLLIIIWAATTPFGYFWPIWPALGWGIPLLLHRPRRTHRVDRWSQ